MDQSEIIADKWRLFSADLLSLIAANYVPDEKLSILIDVDELLNISADIIEQGLIVRSEIGEYN